MTHIKYIQFAQDYYKYNNIQGSFVATTNCVYSIIIPVKTNVTVKLILFTAVIRE